MNKRQITALVMLLLGWAGVYGGARATVVQSLSERDRVKRARLILQAKVISQRAHRVGKNKRLVTDSVLKVQQFLKGRTASSLVTVRTMGGTLGSVTATVSGESQLKKGGRVVVFLTPAKPSPWDPSPTYYYVVGMAYGAYHVFLHPKSRKEHVVRQSSLPAQIRLDRATGTWHTKHRHFTPASVPLLTLKSRIQGHLKALKKPLLQSRPSATQGGQR